MQYQRYPAWSILLRLFHWSFAGAIFTLVVTGLYIHFPWTNSLVEGSGRFPVAFMRYIHFIAGFIFTTALLVRLYLLIFGNRQERFWDFLPITPRNFRNLGRTILFYLYLRREPDHRLGHNCLAGMVYMVTFVVAALQLASGFFLLYPEDPTWQHWGILLFSSQQRGRLLHYLGMWYFIIFVAIHVYIVVWNDIRSKEGLISSIVNGSKYLPQGVRRNH